MRDVALRAGVSAKTVSRVFNDDPHVLPETRRRVEAAMREVNYVPNALATTFRAGRSPVVGIAVPDIVDPFFASIVRAVEDTCSGEGISTLVTSIGDDPAREQPVLESLLRSRLMGLIVAPVADDHSWLGGWADTPVVFVDRPPVGLQADAFVEDDYRGSYLATEHLIEHGHTRIAVVADTLHRQTTERRVRGYRDALAAHGIPVDESLVALGAHGRSGAGREMERLCALPQRPTAVFSSNARVSMALIPALRSLPVALVGFGDFPMADQLTPAVTVIEQDPALLGRLAAVRALQRLREPERRHEPDGLLPVRLVERASCLLPSDAG